MASVYFPGLLAGVGGRQIPQCRLLNGVRENVRGKMGGFASCFDLVLVMLFSWKFETSLRELVNSGVCQSGTWCWKFEKHWVGGCALCKRSYANSIVNILLSEYNYFSEK